MDPYLSPLQCNAEECVCALSEGFAFRYAPFKSVFHRYTENDLSVLIVKGKLLNCLNPFYPLYKLYVC